MNFKKGFTLIELLVVVAIIGILASVVLASLNTARTKGSDAAIKANLDNMRAQAAIDYDSNPNSYTTGTIGNICTADTTITNALTQAAANGPSGTTVVTTFATAETATTVNCYAAAGTYVIEAPLKSSGYWCVDYTGVSAAKVTAAPASAVACPAT